MPCTNCSGVSRAGFTEAREHLREELRAFDRSSAVLLDPEPLPDGMTTTDHGIVLYAATRIAPRQLLPSFWAAVLRYDPTPNPILTTYTTFTSPPPWAVVPNELGNFPPGDTFGEEKDATITEPIVKGNRTLVSIVDEVHRRGARMLDRVCPGGACDPTFGEADAMLAGVMADLGPSPLLAATEAGEPSTAPTYDTAPYLGRARACWWNRASGTRFDVRVELDTEIDSELLVVRGRDGLECAVRGTLEGVPCDVAQFAMQLPTTTGWRTTAAGIRWVRVTLEPVGARPVANSIALFVVERRPQVEGPPAAGQYRELTGFVLPRPASNAAGYQYCTGSAMAPRHESEAARLVEPSPTAPYRAAETCAGLPSDLRIPLENELTSDARPLESSWSHYLELAQRAAAEADALGEDLVRTGLEMDLRSEAAADELSRLCGVSIHLTSIADELGDGSLAAVAPGGPPCMVPYVQQESRCVLDPVLHAATRATREEDMARLASCVGADLVPWATLGDDELCVWDLDPATPGGICEGADPRAMRCPYPADESGSCTGPMPPGAIPIAIEERIGLFRQPAEPPPPPPDVFNLPCAALARARAGLASVDDATRIRSFLTFENASAHARQLTWEPLVGDFSAVRYAGSVVFRTGSVQTGPSTTWPMGAAPPAGAVCPSGAPVSDPLGYLGPLFCVGDVGMASRDARARANDLLARAVMAARIFSGQGLEGVLLPYYASNEAELYRAHEINFGWDPITVAPGLLPTVCAYSGELRIDHRLSGDLAEEYTKDVAELGSRACAVDGPFAPDPPCAGAPAGTDWSVCSYLGGGCRYFDDRLDCDDLAHPDEDVPLVIRAADPELDVDAARRNAQEQWGDDFWVRFVRAAEHSPAELRGPLGLPLDDLTRYFDDWSGSCDHREYEDCITRGEQRLQAEGNLAFIGGTGLTYADWLNGVELMCVAAAQGLPTSDTNCDEPAEVQDLGDAFRVAGYLECRANELSAYGASSIVRDLPRRVVDALKSDGFGSYGSGAGELDAQVSEIRAALIELGTLRTSAAADMRALSSRLRSLQSAVSRHERSREIEMLLQVGRALDRVTSCVTATADAVTTDTAAAAAGAAAATAVCLNSAAQVVIDIEIARLRGADIDDAIIDEYARFDAETTEFARRASERAVSTRAALERIDGALTRVRVTQTQARRALARALLLEDDGLQAHFAVDTAYRARYSTLLERYQRAHRRAVRAAFIARIALEQRLGMPLSDIADDVFSDEPPREWVDTICTLPSIDYDALRMSMPDATGERDGDGALVAPDGYAGAYVGDYVRRLEDVFESYSFVHPFRDGADTAVISLRDDVFRIRAECDVPSQSLLLNGGRLDVLAGADRGGWRIVGCNPAAVGGTGIVDRQCVSIDPLADTSEMPEGGADLGREGLPPPYRLRFGESAATTADSRLEQEVALGPGRYRLSWFGRGAPAELEAAFAIWDEDDVSLRTGSVFSEPVAGSTWRRYWFFFDLDADRVVRVVAAHGSAPPVPVSLDVAGVMVEDVSAAVVGDPDRAVDIPVGDEVIEAIYGQWAAPPPFSEAGDLGLTERRACIDHTGSWFRAEAWVPGCVRTCRDGYDGTCPPEWSETRCYRETSIDVSSDTLSELLLEGDAGFAAGNYNYRIESIAVNLVGTGLRDCTGSGGSSGCFASGNVSYSLLHQGAFLVRNAIGSLYDAPVFPGRVESARALAAERYLTNPLSSADRSLVEPYLRHEFQGRPMGGTLVLRLWDDPRFVFERLEDVQLLVNYRYWQHQR